MRRSLVSLMGLAEAQQLLATDSSKINVSQLADVLKALPKESTVVHSALQHLTTKDNTAIDSFEVSQHTDHFRNLVDLMKASTNDMRVKEYCCRAIANGCLLPSDLLPESLRYTTLEITTSNATSSNSPTKAAQNYADILVEHGAVDGVLNAMSMSPRLRSTHKGACWTATALQNLVVLSRDGAQKAAARDAEEVISNFIMELCEDSLELIQKYHTAARDYSNDALDLESHDGLNMSTVGDALRLRHIAVDAALASLVRILATSEKDNSNGILSRYQRAPAVAAEAAMIALSTPFSIGAATSAVVSGGATMTTSPRSFVFELETQMRTPVLHKAWEVLRLITSHTPNLPMTFDAMQHVSDAIMRRGGGRVLAGMVPLRSHDGQSTKDGHSEAAFGSVSSVVHPFAFALSQQTTAIFGPAFALTEKKADFQLAMVEKEKAAASTQAANETATIKNLSESEEAAEQELLPLKAFNSALATLCDLSAPRKDVAQTSTSSDSPASTSTGAEGEEAVSHGANASIPTEAANMILNAIASGDISKTIVGQLPKRWAKVHQPLGTGSDPRSMVVRGSHAHVCCLYLTLLSNISDIDSVIPSTNCAAVIHSILEEFVAVLQRVSFDIKKVEGGGDGIADANANIKVFRSLYVPVAGKCLELIWNITGIPSGAAALETLGTPALIQRIQTTAKICSSMQIPPAATEDGASSTEEASPQSPKKSEVSELMNSMQELEKLSGKLNEKIQAFITSPTFVHTKKY